MLKRSHGFFSGRPVKVSQLLESPYLANMVHDPTSQVDPSTRGKCEMCHIDARCQGEVKLMQNRHNFHQWKHPLNYLGAVSHRIGPIFPLHIWIWIPNRNSENMLNYSLASQRYNVLHAPLNGFQWVFYYKCSFR